MNSDELIKEWERQVEEWKGFHLTKYKVNLADNFIKPNAAEKFIAAVAECHTRHKYK